MHKKVNESIKKAKLKIRKIPQRLTLALTVLTTCSGRTLQQIRKLPEHGHGDLAFR
jgi:hypothetical protein